MTTTAPKSSMINPADLSLDLQVQRETLDRNLARMSKAGKFDPAKVGSIVVSRRADGTQVILDGAHRTAWAQKEGFKGKIPALVYTGLSLQEEADLFLGLNNSTPVTAVDKFLVACTRGDKSQVKIQEVLRKHGWKITRGNTKGSVKAVQAVESIVKDAAGEAASGEHYEVLDRTMQTITSAWGFDQEGVRSSVLTGIAKLVARFPDLNQARLVTVLKSTSAEVVLRTAKAQRTQVRASSVPVSDFVALVIAHTLYNTGLRKGRLQWIAGAV